uniref:Mating pair stabilization and pilus assembly protein n=1 Tax=Streptomyces sp. 44030 TaxID=364102 RepID=Q2LEW6_9ACTN|nr:hypothetical protein [Streptomyces sp. 44030]ABC67349.1 mating pair stabilization and pilus assembly protein [Streptomyces sp. 44030]
MSKVSNIRRSVDWSVNDLCSASFSARNTEMLKHLDDVKELRNVLDSLAVASDYIAKILGGSAAGLNSFVQRLAERSKDETMPSIYLAMNQSTQDKYTEVLTLLSVAKDFADALKSRTNDAATQLMEAHVVHKTAMNKVLARYDH